MKIVTLLGARPQFIKAAAVSPALKKKHEEFILHTGQHYDYEMSKIFFDELEIPEPDVNLGVGSGSHAEQISKMLPGIEKVLLKRKPDYFVVYGDTNSTLAGALAAAHLKIPVAHIEAGPRTFDMTIPEEVNRVLTDRVASALFAPTKLCARHLAREGISRGVHLTGDVMLDLALKTVPVADRRSKALERFNLTPGAYHLVTIHRPTNVDIKPTLAGLVDALIRLDEPILFPVHPRTRKSLEKFRLLKRLEKAPGVTLCEPLGYLDTNLLTRNAKKVITDSGGLQREAYFLGVPCVSAYFTTEWVETIEDGWNMLIDLAAPGAVEKVKRFKPRKPRRNVFGDGRAAEKIVAVFDRLEKKL